MATTVCVYCREVPADPGYDRCTACRTWRDEEWCEAHNHPHGAPIPSETHSFIVNVSDCTKEQAVQVMAERINPDEDYGFHYEIGWVDPNEDVPSWYHLGDELCTSEEVSQELPGMGICLDHDRRVWLKYADGRPAR